ncbi:hypothetical protein RHEph04_gp072 [Rhizobium phage RHEph04]|uniref:Uncharacterized protein n=1 Tax=Rhizobium phage RHEph04 TaxID=1220604 RepID=L7TJQ3_9CAUD|nr:hypothetical protein FDH25_gp72 [Rhizobium phage RHEph04]AGC35758.1 hypothetical protein RHEph04_gp072 [Rhizobium phage RHEph04]
MTGTSGTRQSLAKCENTNSVLLIQTASFTFLSVEPITTGGLTMALFRKLEDVIVILNTNGVYTQVDAYERNNFRLREEGRRLLSGLRSNSGGTTSPTTLWIEIEGYDPHYDELGRMIT